MKRFSLLFVLTLLVNFSFANLLYDILDGKYRVKSVEIPRSMADGEHYTLLVKNKAVVKYDYKTGATIDTLFSISRLKNSGLKQISGYEFSPNEGKMLVYTNVKYRYRRTFANEML